MLPSPIQRLFIDSVMTISPQAPVSSDSAYGLSKTVIARKVSHTFGTGSASKQVLFDIDFQMRQGEFVILTGPSGAGKTTLLTLAGALRSLQSGSLVVCGTELAGLSQRGQRDIRRQVGFIFQDHNLFEALTAFQTLSLAMVVAGRQLNAAAVRSKAAALLSDLDMTMYLDSRPQQLSVGQQQRIAIARALINDPKIILADEPTASLDAENAQLVIDLLKKRARDGSAVLMVTHDARVFAAANRVVSMIDGRIASSP